MTEMRGETRMEALAAAPASEATRRPRLDVFDAVSCLADGSRAFSLYGSGSEGRVVKGGRDRSLFPPAPATDIF